MEARTVARLGAGWATLPKAGSPRWWIPRGPTRYGEACVGDPPPHDAPRIDRMGAATLFPPRPLGIPLLPRGSAPRGEVRRKLAPHLTLPEHLRCCSRQPSGAIHGPCRGRSGDKPRRSEGRDGSRRRRGPGTRGCGDPEVSDLSFFLLCRHHASSPRDRVCCFSLRCHGDLVSARGCSMRTSPGRSARSSEPESSKGPSVCRVPLTGTSRLGTCCRHRTTRSSWIGNRQHPTFLRSMTCATGSSRRILYWVTLRARSFFADLNTARDGWEQRSVATPRSWS